MPDRRSSGLATLSGLVKATNATARVRTALAASRLDCARMLQQCDMALVTASARSVLGPMATRAALLPVAFHIDHGDAQRIANRLAGGVDGLSRAA